MLEPGESVACIATHGTYRADESSLLVVTDRRTIQLTKKGTVYNQLRHAEVVETTIGESTKGGLVVRVYSESSRLDYAPDSQVPAGGVGVRRSSRR
jgi:hypothetical protein